MKQLLSVAIFFSILLTSTRILAQVGIGTITPDVNAQLDISSPDKGLLIPRMTEAARVNMGAASDGLLVYQTDVSSGFYFRQNGAWAKLNTSGSSIIPYASGSTPISLTTIALGLTGTPAFVGFGSAGQGTTVLGATISRTSEPSNYAFSLPRAGVIESIAAHFTFSNLTFIYGTITLTAQLYSASSFSNTFTLVPGAVVTLSPAISGAVVNAGTICTGLTSGLNILVAPETRLLMVYSAAAPGAGNNNVLIGHVSGGISIAGQ